MADKKKTKETETNSKSDNTGKDIVPFDKGKPQRAIKRPSNPLNKWMKEQKGSYQITRKDVLYIYRNVIFTKTFGQLKELMGHIEGGTDEELAAAAEKRDKLPALVVAIVSGVLGDIARGTTINMTRMLQLVFPDLRMPLEGDGSFGAGGYDEIEELEAALRRLEGDDSIMIVDKLIAAEDAEFQVVD